MIEPTLLDYLRAAMQLSEQKFCESFPHPVLISREVYMSDAFREAKTRVAGSEKATGPLTSPTITDVAPVLAVRPAPGSQGAEVSLGRSEDCDLVIPHETVSGTQAVFVPHDQGHTTLIDMAGTNASRVNDEVLEQGRSTPLADGDKLAFGDCIFVFYTPAGFYAALRPNRP